MLGSGCAPQHKPAPIVVTRLQEIRVKPDQSLLNCLPEPVLPDDQGLRSMPDREQADLIVDVTMAGRDCLSRLDALRAWYEHQPATANH